MNRLSIVTILVIATCGLASAAVPATAAAETTPPTITITSPTDGQYYALNAPITASFSCADPGGSGVAACVRTGPAASTATAGPHTFTVFAADNDGNTATRSVSYFVDATGPTITISSPADGQHFALGAPIFADYACDDPGGSGVATCTSATPVDTSVGTHTFTVNATDNVGNAASKTITYTVDPDTTPPTITITSPVEGQHFGLNSQIIAAFSCNDTQTGIATCVAAGPASTATPGPKTYTVNATDGAGNPQSKTVNYVVDPDTTDPTITITSPIEGQHYALGAQVNGAYSCDDQGGSGLATCVAAGPVVTNTPGPHTFTVNATDGAGNAQSKTVNYVVDPDTTAPTITITSPVNGRHYPLGTVFGGAYTCDDAGGAGVATCFAANTIDLTAGTHVFTVNATDRAGNSATSSVTYTIDPAPGGGGGTPGAGVTPPPPPPPAQTPPPPPAPVSPPPAPPPSTPRVTVPAQASTAGLTRGVSVSLSGLKPRSRVVLQIRRGLRTIKTLRATANSAGRVTFKIRFTRRQVRTLKGKTLTLRFTTTAANNKRKVVSKKLKVR